MNTQDQLCTILQEWCASQSLPLMSADELEWQLRDEVEELEALGDWDIAAEDLHELKTEQREWLKAFIILWG